MTATDERPFCRLRCSRAQGIKFLQIKINAQSMYSISSHWAKKKKKIRSKLYTTHHNYFKGKTIIVRKNYELELRQSQNPIKRAFVIPK